jgi:hypothetical protein
VKSGDLQKKSKNPDGSIIRTLVDAVLAFIHYGFNSY